MKIYNRYLLKKISGYFFIIATILVCLVWFSKAISFIKYITDNGIKLTEFLYLFVLVLPWLVLLIIPISLFIATLLVYSKMSSSNELTILKNSGLNKIYLARPAIWVALACCIFCYSLSFYLMPMANKELRLAKVNFQHNYDNIMISPGIFETLNNLTIYVKDRNIQNELFGVMIYDNRNVEYALTVTAEYGQLDRSDEVLLHLKNGTVQKFNYLTKKSEILKFDSYVVNLSNSSNEDASFVWKAHERYLWELLNPEQDSTPEYLLKYRVEIHKRITYPTFSFILVLIAAAFSFKGQFSRRVNIFNEVQATICGVVFIVSVMALYDVIEKKPALIPLLYLDLAIFIISSLIILRTKKTG